MSSNAVQTDSESNRRPLCPCCSYDLFLPRPLGTNVIPTDTSDIDSRDQDGPLSPQEAARIIQLESLPSSSKEFFIFDTHHHAHLERAEENDVENNQRYTIENDKVFRLRSLVCAVEPKDWPAALQYAAQSKLCLPALGVHPWYLENLDDDWLEKLERHLILHPFAFVGEIGLCKMARFVRKHPNGKAAGLAIQRDVFRKQLTLAARLKRPVSVHCVDQHGVFLDVLKCLAEERGQEENVLPPTIVMHSFTGTAHQVQQLLRFETDLKLQQPLFYFGFSHAVNFVMCQSEKSRRKGRDAVRAVPVDRIVAESDVHRDQDCIGGTIGGIAYIAWARDKPSAILEIAERTHRNGVSILRRLSEDIVV